MRAKFYPVILAGGRGTRFWPLSRKRRAKQVLALDGDRTMIQQTGARLLPRAPATNCWVITNAELRPAIRRQLPRIKMRQVLAEPVGRNTAPAIGLAAFILLRRDPRAVLGMFPSDHVITEQKKFRKIVEKAAALAAEGDNMVVMGIKPARPETGYGYIEAGESAGRGVLRARRFTEKPNAERAQEFLDAGHYYWNSGMFVWGAQNPAHALRGHLFETVAHLEEIAAAFGTAKFWETFRPLFSQCENIN